MVDENAVAAFLLSKKYHLAALELHQELLEVRTVCFPVHMVCCAAALQVELLGAAAMLFLSSLAGKQWNAWRR